MPTKNLSFEDCDTTSIYKAVEKGTQTSSTGLSRSSTHMDPDKDKDKDSTTVFEICHVEQDPYCPKSITIVKETVSQEVHKHENCESDKEVSAHRYVYKKEVIEPYLEPDPSLDCKTKDELVAAALHSAVKDFPDYKHCLQMEDKGSKHSCPDKNSPGKVNAVTSIDPSAIIISMIETGKNKDKSSHSLQEKCSRCTPEPPCANAAPVKEHCPRSSSDLAPGQNNITKSCADLYKSAENITKLVKSSVTRLLGTKECPKQSSECKQQPAPHDARDDSCSHQHECDDGSADAEPGRGARLKAAVGDFVSKVYQTTHDAVTVITTESAKQIEKFRKSKSDDCTIIKESKPAETSSGFKFFKKAETEGKKCSESGPESGPEGGEVCAKLVDKVGSSVSMMSSLLRGRSSPHDVPTPPRDVSHELRPDVMPASGSVFATIKSTLFSMFYDIVSSNGPPSRGSLSSTSLETSDTEDDAGFMNRFID
ncbi:uncharacterized protein LOC114242891 [Bombyx mandarina]|uniref:Uncharacterized protein LOC114242891 n=1 Tax=Bombyx mandarina TaxID=7092 RepID=A0A6J2JLU0_BOMMA|nr:uncharacterized protein LOC114242891 [Bombyx mandarina]